MRLPSIYSDQHGWQPFLNLGRCAAAPVIVRSLTLHRFRGTYLVRCDGNDGAVGVATVNQRARVLYPMFAELVAPAFVGADARDLEILVNRVYTFRNNYKYQGTAFWNCVAYAEAAILDMLGRTVDRGLGQLLGDVRRTEIPVYLSSMRRDTTPEDEVAWVGARLEQTGAKAVKLKIGGRMRSNADSLPGRTEALIRLARATFGPAVTLYMDANGSYDHSRAIEIGRMMEDCGYAWLEEPCPFEQYEETKLVADALDIPIAGGEQDCNLGHFRQMIRSRTVDVIQPDMMYNGGVIRAMRVARMAADVDMMITPHSPKHSPELATLLHFAAVVPNVGPYLEFPAVPVTHDDWYAPAFTVQFGGTVSVSVGPGLGIEYDDGIWSQAVALG